MTLADMLSGEKPDIAAIEKHPRMHHAVVSQFRVGEGRPARVGPQQAMKIVIVPRYPLTFLAQYATPLEPAS